MKPILIDDLINDDDGMQQEFTVNVDGKPLIGYQVAKPLNYDPKYTPKEDREKMAQLVLEGKAIAVQYFEDLTEDERSEYVKSKM